MTFDIDLYVEYVRIHRYCRVNLISRFVCMQQNLQKGIAITYTAFKWMHFLKYTWRHFYLRLLESLFAEITVEWSIRTILKLSHGNRCTD